MAAPVLYLVSRSPRRRELLAQIRVGFELLTLRSAPGRPPDVDETPLPGEDPVAYVLRVARAKADSGWQRVHDRKLPLRPALAADTTVSLDGNIVGKPASRDEAVEMLLALSGRTHDVHTAVALDGPSGMESAVSSSRVSFRALSAAECRAYADTGEPMDKAGAYAVQGIAGAFVTRLEGSYSGVMGLPLFETAALLARVGIAVV